MITIGGAFLAYSGWVNFNIIIQCRDGRARVQVINITHKNKPGNAPDCNLGLILDTEEQFTKGLNKKFHNKVCEDIKGKILIEAEGVFKSIEETFSKGAANAEEDW